jgi:hypothetical protein
VLVPAPVKRTASAPSPVLQEDGVGRVVQEHHAVALEADEAGVAHLARNTALALVEPVVDRRGDRHENVRGLAGGRRRLEALAELLGDEVRREPALPPARVGHHGGQERDVVPDPVDREAVEGRPLGAIASSRSGRGHEAWRSSGVVDR